MTRAQLMILLFAIIGSAFVAGAIAAPGREGAFLVIGLLLCAAAMFFATLGIGSSR